MPYIYRYIDLEKEEVIYVGKVTRYKDIGYDPLRNRHEQHKREPWYKDNADNIVMEYIELDSHCDADILETWLINYYDGTGQLLNSAKCGWGKSKLDFYSMIFGRWRVYGLNLYQNSENIRTLAYDLVQTLDKYTEGFTVNIDSQLEIFCDEVKAIKKEREKANKLTRYHVQDDFLRGDIQQLNKE